MRSDIEYINDYLEGFLSKDEQVRFKQKLFEDETLRHDYALIVQINDFMRGQLDLTEVLQDPLRHDLNSEVKEMVTDYNENSQKYAIIKEFVENSLKQSTPIDEVQNEIDQIKQEIEQHGINEISAEWVKEWNLKNENGTIKDSNISEINSFVTNSLAIKKNKLEIKIESRKIEWYKTSLVRIVSLSAAALIILFLLIKTLTPSANTGELYENYYKPFDAFSMVKRNSDNDQLIKCKDAIEKYKTGDYQSAASILTNLIQKDTNSSPASFFYGITLVELQDYQKAISFLTEAVGVNNNYKKDAQWYLGLSYLKVGDKQKAILCFKELAAKQGYYQHQAQALLNQLQ